MAYAQFDVNKENAKSIISASDIYWVRRDQSRLLVCRAGDLLSHARLDRFPKITHELKVNEEKIQHVVDVMSCLASSKSVREKMLVVNQVRAHWQRWFVSDEKLTPLELVILGERIMHEPLQGHAEIWAKASTELFHRSCTSGTLLIFGAVSLGYHSWSFLGELWRMAFSYSATFALEEMSQRSLPCLELARTKKYELDDRIYSGMRHDSSMEVVFNFHPTSSKRSFYELSDLERWYGHIQQMIPWDKNILKETAWWKNFHSEDDFKIINKIFENEKVRLVEDHYINFEL
jgi:hypothetical protein